jgi:hypothetical protein
MSSLVLTTLGVGAAASPRFAPAGMLVERGSTRLMLDGGPGSEPSGRLDAWLVSDEHAELMPQIRRIARRWDLEPRIADFSRGDLVARFHRVVHTSHLAGGYLISCRGLSVAWAPEFWEFPSWAAGVDLMFAEASAWKRPIRFTGGVGGHMDVLAVAAAAEAHHVRRLVFAHIGRSTLQAIDRGETPPFGEYARDGQAFSLQASPGET